MNVRQYLVCARVELAKILLDHSNARVRKDLLSMRDTSVLIWTSVQQDRTRVTEEDVSTLTLATTACVILTLYQPRTDKPALMVVRVIVTPTLTEIMVSVSIRCNSNCQELIAAAVELWARDGNLMRMICVNPVLPMGPQSTSHYVKCQACQMISPEILMSVQCFLTCVPMVIVSTLEKVITVNVNQVIVVGFWSYLERKSRYCNYFNSKF